MPAAGRPPREPGAGGAPARHPRSRLEAEEPPEPTQEEWEQVGGGRGRLPGVRLSSGGLLKNGTNLFPPCKFRVFFSTSLSLSPWG